ncbi:hypothetical protein DVH24_005658 [Malus domestica]|uniref:Uncharacterized protein n=1 Tax=Malus domestica TaxID=3750 RepID=A0A498IMP6_MALDO|nr:hypothetical protein DVH24_005658 [Malus domestica]
MEASSDRRIRKFISINFFSAIIVLPVALSSSSLGLRRRPSFGDGAKEEGGAQRDRIGGGGRASTSSTTTLISSLRFLSSSEEARWCLLCESWASLVTVS